MSDFPSLTLWVLGWIFLVIGLISIATLVIYTKYGRETSIRLSILSIITSAIFLAFSFHFILLSFGL